MLTKRLMNVSPELAAGTKYIKYQGKGRPEMFADDNSLDICASLCIAQKSALEFLEDAYPMFGPVRHKMFGPYHIDLYLEKPHIAIDFGFHGYTDGAEARRRDTIDKMLRCKRCRRIDEMLKCKPTMPNKLVQKMIEKKDECSCRCRWPEFKPFEENFNVAAFAAIIWEMVYPPQPVEQLK